MVPQAAQTSVKTYSAIWVGMDGYKSVTQTTVEQVGTEQDYINGTPQYYAWYELYPAASHMINNTVHPSDVMSGEVKYSNGQYTLTLRDVTQNWYFMEVHQLNKAIRNSAEWIVEAPGNIILPLANFGTVNFTSCSASINGVSGSINSRSWQNTPVDMIDFNGVLRAQTSKLSGDGDSFTVTYFSGN